MNDADPSTRDRYWIDDHPVLELIRAREAAGTGPGRHGDGHRLGLAVEGGGMRGIVSAAMLTALDDLGLNRVFDAVYSCSSGAINAAYFLSGSSWYPLTIYFDDLATRQFLDLRRFVLPGPMLDLHYVFEEVLALRKPLDYGRILKGDTELHIALSRTDTLEPEWVSRYDSPDDLKAALRASCWLPLAVPGTGEFRGRPAVDGGVLTAHPSLMAVADGCTHVLSLSTKPLKPPPATLPLSYRFSAAPMERLRRGLGRAYLRSVDAYRTHRGRLQRWMTEPVADPAYVLDLPPLPWMARMTRHRIAPAPVFTAARQAHSVMHAAYLGVPAGELRDGRFASLPRLIAVRRDGSGRSVD
ncbi:MAG TPA: patatin-like phospholipase family protein [Glycomyces sp.]|nr:patatin-like phospholipase family protein [Glycomyces sp.]